MEKQSNAQKITNSTQTKGIDQSEKSCIRCGAPLKRGKQYCSATCGNKARAGRGATTNCESCGKEIPLGRKNRPTRFCSVDCRDQSRAKEATGRYVGWAKLRDALKSDSKKCQRCGEEENLHVHHIDHDSRNNLLENLVVLCQSCHIGYHRLHDYHQMTFEQFMTSK